ncbi:aminotransferase class V-fold PLP-dependent enzyme [Actinoallomurus bryophytorum]|uniref:Selenocysteine lyase/cysteine desulfurase n=1 Tax=Actinoallomurus bryophytorum TaxID=1490222 RepID=A0A543CVD0_9ACTN|nr:aminotransferase class V-fold PLP-dependent enzyme [Actinoallomurus bryophytorum]TQM01064.1 selenocysteine lyase/cysteine desulfurase [Actinoallomurus bryophytorum]
MELREAVHLWQAEPGWLNTASYGLPPEPTMTAVRNAMSEWQRGSSPWVSWDASTDRARVAFARLVGAGADDIAVGSAVSQLLAPVAASLPPGANVVVPDIEFTSNLFPWLVQDLRVRTVPANELADAIDSRTAVVAFSVVQSATGEIAAVDDILKAARANDALVVADASQAAGWLPVDATRFDVLACAGYKWLMTPRGAAFCYVAPAVRDRIRPSAAGWYAGEEHAFYGPPLRLASSARRFDISPAWFSYVGAAPSLELMNEIGVEQIRDHDVALADRFLAGLGLPSTGSAIVSVDVPGAEERLEAAGVRAAVRDGRLRASFHLYTTEADVDLALEALTGAR